MTRFELATSAWQAGVFPLNYIRVELDYLLKCVRPVRYLDYDSALVVLPILRLLSLPDRRLLYLLVGRLVDLPCHGSVLPNELTTLSVMLVVLSP